MKTLIAPSILSANFACLAEEIKSVEEAGADWIHVDVMDGRFVPNITVGPFIVEAVRSVTRLPIDVHLMIVEPEKYLKDFAQAGANVLTVHQEACPHLERTLASIRDLGCKAGVSINPATHYTTLEYVLHQTDLVLVMTVNPGFGGQSFIQETVPKIEGLNRWRTEWGPKFHIEVDGGVNPKTASIVKQAGADVLVAGSAVFGAADRKKVMEELRSA